MKHGEYAAGGRTLPTQIIGDGFEYQGYLLRKDTLDMKQKYLTAWMDIVERFAETSDAKRLKVAAFLFKNGNVVSHACNGTPAGWHTNDCEDKVYMGDDAGGWLDWQDIEQYWPLEDEIGRYKLVTKDCVIHAEEQCLQKMWHSHETTENTMMIISHSPCLKCSLKIKSAGIVRVYYKHDYRDSSGIDYLKQNGVEVIKLEE